MFEARVGIVGSAPICEGFTEESDEGHWFDPVRYLGKRGHKYLTEPTKYLLASAERALEASKFSTECWTPERCGVVVGTNFAVEAELEAIDRAVLSEGAQALMPMQAPNFSVNIPASQISIRKSFRAFNITLTTPLIAGMQSIELAARAISTGRADLVLAATTDGPPPSKGAGMDAEQARPGACAMVLTRGVGASLAASAAAYSPGPACDVAVAVALAKQLSGRVLRPLRWQHVAFESERACVMKARLTAALEAEGIEASPREALERPERYMTAGPLLALLSLSRDTQGKDVLVTTFSPRGHLAALLLRCAEGEG